MALIFPAILILIVALMEIGFWYRIRILTDTGIQEALRLTQTLQNQGTAVEEAVLLADQELEAALEEIGDFSRDWEIQNSYLKESVSLSVWGNYGSVLPLSYQESQRLSHPDPRRFRDRVDLICEKINAK